MNILTHKNDKISLLKVNATDIGQKGEKKPSLFMWGSLWV